MNKSEIKRLFPDIDPGAISFLQVLDRFHEGVTITDANGVVLYMNEAQARMDDFGFEDMIGEKVTTLYRVDEGFSPVMACLKTGEPINNLACYYRTHLGRMVNSINNTYPITARGRLIGTICLITDYKNIEHTFDTVMKSQPHHFLPTYGVAHSVDITRPKKNGTRYTFKNIYAAKKGKGIVRVVGLMFQEKNYGMALRVHSPYRDKINVALLKLIEEGAYRQIKEKWFGS